MQGTNEFIQITGVIHLRFRNTHPVNIQDAAYGQEPSLYAAIMWLPNSSSSEFIQQHGTRGVPQAAYCWLITADQYLHEYCLI